MKHTIPASNTDAASAASFQSTPTVPTMPTAPTGNPTPAPPYVTPGKIRDTAPASSPAPGTGIVTYPDHESDSMINARAFAAAKEFELDEYKYLIEQSARAEVKSSVGSNLFASCGPPIKTVPIVVDDLVFRTFRSGLKVLIEPWDVAKAAGSYRHTIVELAGDKNTASFPKSDFAQYSYYPEDDMTAPIFSRTLQ